MHLSGTDASKKFASLGSNVAPTLEPIGTADPRRAHREPLVAQAR
jgi:hypothetical protein